ncbi:MAG: patatin family protein [Clostridia bacterium]|nr:patatin family protein [Clostridia bacterium]
MKTGVVFEGGAIRTVYSCGVMDGFIESGIDFDYLVGVSAGIAYGVSFISKQFGRNHELLMKYAPDRRYMGFGNMLRPGNRHCYFGLDFGYVEIPRKHVIFDYDAFAKWPGLAEAVVTDIETGEAVYVPLDLNDPNTNLLEASCAMPLLFPIFDVNGRKCLDGGCADAIPWKRAFDMGCDRVVVVLTREREYRRKTESIQPLIELAYRKYPKFVETMRTRAERSNADRAELFKAEQEGRVFIFAPESTEGFSRTERDTNKIDALWNQGLTHAREKQEALKAFLTQ